MPLSIAGHVIDEPMPIWRVYARDHGRTIREYDDADPGDPYVLTGDEAWLSRIIGSHVRHIERDMMAKGAWL
jgi:hypothetical protein